MITSLANISGDHWEIVSGEQDFKRSSKICFSSLLCNLQQTQSFHRISNGDHNMVSIHGNGRSRQWSMKFHTLTQISSFSYCIADRLCVLLSITNLTNAYGFMSEKRISLPSSLIFSPVLSFHCEEKNFMHFPIVCLILQKQDWPLHKLECSAMCVFGQNWNPSETVRLTARILAKQVS